jgi:hypothetical protein
MVWGKVPRQSLIAPDTSMPKSGAGAWVPGSGFRVPGSWFLVPGSGFRVPGSGFRVPDSGIRTSQNPSVGLFG